MKLRVPKKVVIIKPGDEEPKLPVGALVAAAYLKTVEVQDLGEQIGDLTKAAVGYDLKIQVRVKVGGVGKRPPPDVVEKINAKLDEVSKDLKLV